MQTPENSQRSLLDKILFSPEERRLRAGWRISTQNVIMMAIMMCGGLLQFAFTELGDTLTFKDQFLGQISFAIAATVSIFLARRWLDKRTITSLGLGVSRGSFRDFSFGFLLGLILTGSILVTCILFNWTQIEGISWQTQDPIIQMGGLLMALIFFALVGWTEEILARGYLLQNLIDGINLPAAVLFSSAAFSFLHIINPGFSWLAAMGILAAGLLFAYSYLKTGQLWLAIGLHIGWNFFLGPVFGFPVSGIELTRLVKQTTRGPALWTGGEFGPEAGLIIFPVLFIGGLLIHLYMRGMDKRQAEPQKTDTIPEVNST